MGWFGKKDAPEKEETPQRGLLHPELLEQQKAFYNRNLVYNSTTSSSGLANSGGLYDTSTGAAYGGSLGGLAASGGYATGTTTNPTLTRTGTIPASSVFIPTYTVSISDIVYEHLATFDELQQDPENQDKMDKFLQSIDRLKHMVNMK